MFPEITPPEFTFRRIVTGIPFPANSRIHFRHIFFQPLHIMLGLTNLRIIPHYTGACIKRHSAPKPEMMPSINVPRASIPKTHFSNTHSHPNFRFPQSSKASLKPWSYQWTCSQVYILDPPSPMVPEVRCMEFIF